MVVIKSNGVKLVFESKEDLHALREENYPVWYGIRTNNKTLIQWAYELYLDELDRQDGKSSTGSYGKHAEVWARVSYALENGTAMFLHDVRCRKQNMDDQRIAGIRIEHKTGFAQWEYGASYDECMAKLERKAAAGVVWHWEPFKDERVIEMPLAELLEVLKSYSEKKGLKVWFGFLAKKGQLQIQPVEGISAKRKAFIESLLDD